LSGLVHRKAPLINLKVEAEVFNKRCLLQILEKGKNSDVEKMNDNHRFFK
jgi:hypothetical protein